ncbi:MAG: hypothetical protein KDB03_04515 [Planctomycetales bacterium]|nr:hypothetical protein [Planctomycetales bacterium]
MPRTRSRHVTQAVPTYELVWQQAHQALKQADSGLIDRQARQEATGRFVRLRECLERLPIAQNDFGMAICRLENAERYNGNRELGAATILVCTKW